jgi:putative PIN family toxin of toxin-antitoxin system
LTPKPPELVVLDVNVLISAYLSERSPPGMIYSACLDGSLLHAISRDMTDKVAEVLSRPKFRRRMEHNDPLHVATSILDMATLIVEPDPATIGVADDLEDDRVLGVAVASGAKVLVTGDKGLLAVDGHMGIRICTPRDFLELTS